MDDARDFYKRYSRFIEKRLRAWLLYVYDMGDRLGFIANE
jgi:hypothetical protein